MNSNTPPPTPRAAFWRALRVDATFRNTVLFVGVVPALLATAIAVWILRAVLVGG